MKTTWGQGEQSLQVAVSGLIDWGGAAGGAGPGNLIRGKSYSSSRGIGGQDRTISTNTM